jgi:luciferase family oxidoreductase group 1
MRIGMLDYGRNYAGEHPASFLQQLLDRVRLAEELRFSRYWLAEHQAAIDSWATTQLPLLWLAQQTHAIRLGSAGVLLDYHRPIEVASDFNLLEHLHPGRIDLGVARGKPHAPYAEMLQEPSYAFDARLRDLLRYLGDDASEVRALPAPRRRPEMWALGTSDVSMRLALENGLNYAHSIFHPFPPSYAGLQSFVAERATPALRAVLSVAGTCAETNEEAQRIVREHDDAFSIVPRVIGDVETCAALMRGLLAETGADEVVFVDVARSAEDRRKTLVLLARLLD